MKVIKHRHLHPVWSRLFGFGLVFLLAGSSLAAAPALPLAPALDVDVTTITAQPVLTGQAVTWQVDYTCASVDENCLGATMVLPRPDGMTETGQSLTVDPDQVAGYAFDQGYGSNGAFLVDFVDPLPAGSLGQMLVTYGTANGITPDGTVYTLVATFDADNADAVSASDTVEMEAAVSIVVQKVGPDQPWPLLDTAVQYTVHPCAAASNVNYGNWWIENAVLVDYLPPGSVYVESTTNGVLDPSSYYDAGSHTVTWPAETYGQNSCTGAKRHTITIEYPSSVFAITDVVTNTATVTGHAYATPDYLVTATGQASHGFTAASPGYWFVKSNSEYPDYKVSRGELFRWNMWFANSGNVPLDVTIDDPLPEYFRTTEWTVINNPAEISYATNLAPSLTLLPGGAQTGVFPVSSLGLSPGEYVTRLQFFYDDLPPGSPTGLLWIYGFVSEDTPESVSAVTNCATASAVYDGQALAPITACSTVYLVPARPVMGIGKTVDPSSPVVPGDSLTFGLSPANDGVATEDLHPIITDLLPDNLAYVPGSVVYNTAELASFLNGVAPQFEVIDNYAGTGRQLLRWSWPGGQGLSPGEYTHTLMQFAAQVKDGTPAATYTNQTEVTEALLQSYTCSYWGNAVQDQYDLDGDGDTTDTLCKATAGYTVASYAAARGIKWVKGELDDTWTQYPDRGLTNAAGAIDYRLVLTNQGNVALTGLIAYDILPYIGDTGVSELQAGVPRGSQWRAVLQAPISPPAGASVAYSQSANPCRPEVYTGGPPGCDNDWSATPPADLASVQSLKFDLDGTVLDPGQTVEILWDMAAPPGIEPNETAWNSFAYTGQRADTGDDLLVSEPPKVGVQVPSDKVAIGNLVWADDNHNSRFDDGAEVGIDSVSVLLYPAGASPGDGSEVATTTTAGGGYYQFLEVEPGDYFVAVVVDGVILGPGGTYSASSPGGNHNPDTAGDHDQQDGDDGVPAGAVYVVSEMLTASRNGQVVTTDSGDPAGYLDDSAYMTVDFGFTSTPNRIGLQSLSATPVGFGLVVGWGVLWLVAIALWIGRRKGIGRFVQGHRRELP